MRHFKAFTLVELLVSIAIIGLLIGLLIPNIDRSLDKNNLANDVDLFKSKLEEVRLLAGSTQQVDESSNEVGSSDEVGYYAVVIPANSSDYFGVIKIGAPLPNSDPPSNPPPLCPPDTGARQLSEGVGAGENNCVIEKLKLSKSIEMIGAEVDQFIAFNVPTQKMFRLVLSVSTWMEASPIFSPSGPVFELTYPGLVAKVSLDDYTARVTVEYEQNP